MDQKRLHELEEQCIQECAPPCSANCPVHVDIRALTSEIGQGNFSAALKLFKKAVPFPGIIARICDQPCQAVCNRQQLGGAIQVVLLERACLQNSPDAPARLAVLPSKDQGMAVIGGGLSGLTAAFDLARKGYRVSLFEAQNRLGGTLWQFPETVLPRAVIEDDLAVLQALGVSIRLNEPVSGPAALSDLIKEFEAVYLGLGAQPLRSFDLNYDEYGYATVDPLTFSAGQTGLFAGGSLLHPPSPIRSVSDGRRAAISIDRYLQKVSLTASRLNEGAYATRLFTATPGVEPVRQVQPAGPDGSYSPPEAAAEARRCLQCECLECVKVCEYLSHYGSYPKKYTRQIYNNLTMIMRARTSNQLINSCALCGLCVDVCPQKFDMGALCQETRQTMVATGKMPVSAHDFALRDMAFSNSPAFTLAHKPAAAEPCRYVFFPGCQLSASNPHYVTQIYDDLSARMPGGTGLLLRCCGAPADWAGQSGIFQASLDELRSQYQTLGSPQVILACSSCYRIFKSYLPEIPITSLWEIYDRHGLPERDFTKYQGKIAIHDPCSTRHESPLQDSIRRIASRLGAQVQELPLSRQNTECCGYGGLVWLAHPQLAKNIIQRRIHESPYGYLTYCSMCRDFFSTQGKPTLHILDLIFGEQVAELARRKSLGYSQRHANRVGLKQHFLKAFSVNGDKFLEEPEKIHLKISAEVRELLDKRLILDEDLQKVIEHAESTQSKFIRPGSGHILASYRPANVTYWVEYSSEAGGFTIYGAYSHRMEIDKGATP